MYYTLWQTLQKFVFHLISNFLNGGADLPFPRVLGNSGSQENLGLRHKFTISLHNLWNLLVYQSLRIWLGTQFSWPTPGLGPLQAKF